MDLPVGNETLYHEIQAHQFVVLVSEALQETVCAARAQLRDEINTEVVAAGAGDWPLLSAMRLRDHRKG